jgi:hypothetical protein
LLGAIAANPIVVADDNNNNAGFLNAADVQSAGPKKKVLCYPFEWQRFLALFVYASLSSQSRGSILYMTWC